MDDTTKPAKRYCIQCRWYKEEKGIVKKRLNWCDFLSCYQKPYTKMCRFFKAILNLKKTV